MQQAHEEYKKEGINWLFGAPGGNILDGCLPTSTHADIKLIGAWMAYWWGRTRAEQTHVRPTRGHSYILDCAEPLRVKVVNPTDHREGVECH